MSILSENRRDVEPETGCPPDVRSPLAWVAVKLILAAVAAAWALS